MSEPLTVLITNAEIDRYSGTELYVRDLALRLQQLGHRPIVFSERLGPLAEELIAATVPVVDKLDAIGVRPDIIHGHHHPGTMMALLHFAGVPGIFVCHDWSNWRDIPPQFPRIRRYCAVDDTCRDKLSAMGGIPEALICTLQNAVDLQRFVPRPPLPEKPRRALIFSNYEYDITPLQEACAACGVQLDRLGEASRNAYARPEELLPRYDLVFAKARAAREALAVGAAVIVCDFSGMAGLVTRDNFESLRALNFGRRSLRQAHDAQRLIAEIQRYDAADAAAVCARVRAVDGLTQRVEALLDLYHRVIAEQLAAPTSADDEGRAAARYLRDWGFLAWDRWLRRTYLQRLPKPLSRMLRVILMSRR